ncbi:putative acetyltransferase [Klebsiella pneumoniae]|nr:putative acetyltransferase [Klebsiella pneumoniae]
MDAIFDRVVREFFPNTTIPFWKKWLFRTAFGNKVFSRLIYNERLVKEGANKQVISSQADSLIKISRIWADFFPANTSNQPI